MLAQKSSSSPRVAVVCLQFDNRGDIIGARKIWNAVCHILGCEVPFCIETPNFQLAELFLFASANFIDVAAEMPETKSWNLIEAEEVVKIESIRGIILYPTYHDPLIPASILESDKTLIKLREYGASIDSPKLKIEGGAHILGFGEGECGVLFDNQAYDYYKEHKTDPPSERLKNLLELPAPFVKALLGEEPSQESVTHFADTNQLYGGYAHEEESILRFVHLLASKTPTDRSLTICLLGPNIAGFEKKLNLRALLSSQFKAINICYLKDDDTLGTLSFNIKTKKSTGERILRIIFYRLPSESISVFLKSIEMQILATVGDNRFFEGLAHGKKIVCNEYKVHKRDMIYSFLNLVKKFNKGLADKLSDAYFMKEGERDLFDSFQNPASRYSKDWMRAVDEIAYHHDFESSLRKMLQPHQIVEGEK